MTNQELFEQAVAGNWVAEEFSPRSALGGVGRFCLTGSGVGYSRFSDSIDNGQVVFYAAFDDDCNREAGYGIFNADEMSITPVETTATLRDGRYIDGDVAPIPFPNGGTITCTFNAVAFNSIWSHIWDKNNPHDVNASQVDQDNENIPGDNVQSALDFLVKALGSEGINLKHIDGNYTYIEIKHGPSYYFLGGYGWDENISSWDDLSGSSWLSGYWDQRQASWDDSSGEDWFSADPVNDIRLAELKLNHDTGDLWTRLIDDSVVKICSKGSSEPEPPPGGDGELPGGPTSWDEITGKPSTFPPESHTHVQSEVDGLELRLEAIEGSITDGGGFVDAPDDGKLYGRQSEAWAEVVIPSTAWDDITSKPTEFPPSAHTHEIEDVNGLQDALNNGSGPPVYVDEDAPENPAKGNLWYDTNSGALNLFDGSDWVVIGSGGGNVVLLLPVSSRSGAMQLPLNQDGDAVPVMLRSGASELPLNDTGNKFTVNTRSGDLDLPLMVA